MHATSAPLSRLAGNDARITDTRYPAPKISPFPVFSLGALWGGNTTAIPSVLDAGTAMPVTTGRMALAWGLRTMGIGNGDRVLVPAYHCNSMVEPIVHRKAEPAFYRVRCDASVDLEDVDRRIDAATRAIIVTHYFGFPQDMEAIRSFCDARRLILIEDCAHAFFGEYAGVPLGAYGDFAFASPMKFFPLYDGGLYVSRVRPEGGRWTSAGSIFELRAIDTILSRSVAYQRLGALRLPVRAALDAAAWLMSFTKTKGATQRVADPTSESPTAPRYGFAGYFSGREGEFDPDWIDVRMSRVSRLLMRKASMSRMITKRRANYERLHEAFRTLPGCAPLYPELPSSVVPYVYPLVVDRPDDVFRALKQRGVPILRFGEYQWRNFIPSEFPEADELSRKVFQFPCHQELTAGELEWMIASIRGTMEMHQTM